jgi:hypothetical protein
MTDTDERLTRIETKLDVLAEQWGRRFSALQWTVGLGVTWLTVLIGLTVWS